LYFGLATPEQARAVSARLDRDFLKGGGFATTLIASGQQWDAPNGWPPLQWLAMEGSRRYGRADLANRARIRWLTLNRAVHQITGKMTEKYDVVDMSRRAGGGEYPTQDGFGWTNGVALALSAQERAQRDTAPARVPELDRHADVSRAGHVTVITLLTASNAPTSKGVIAGIPPHQSTSGKERHRDISQDHPTLRGAAGDGVREHCTVVVPRQR
jgi:Trehalase